jgi:hypothetical protein
MPMAPAVAFAQLTNNVETFLKRYPVRIFGAVAASAVRGYYLENRGNSFRPGSFWGTHNWHATESFNIRDPAVMAAAGPNHAFFAHSIHMDTGVAAMGFYRLDNTGPAIMVTGQLSGCSFVVQPAGGNDLDVAHVQPVPGATGIALAGTLDAALPNAFIYGATGEGGFYTGANRTVSIIGIRNPAGQWSLYAQKHDRTTGDFRIRSVYRIHPDHSKL